MIAGQLEIQLLANVARLQQDMDRAQRTIRDTVDRMNNILATIGVGVSLAGIAGMIKGVADVGDKLNDLSKITGLTVVELGGLEKAAKLSGSSLDTIAKGMGALSKNMFDGSDAFRLLGIATKDANGQLRNAGQVFLDVADRFSRMEDGAAKAAIASEIFGKAGRDLIPTLNEGRSSLENYIDEYEKYSGMSQEVAEASDGFNDNLEILHGRVQAITTTFVGQLLPTLNNIGTAMLAGEKSTNQFSFAAQVVVPVLKGLAIAGFTVVDTFRGMGREIGARAAQLTALAQMDFKGATFIGEELAKDNAKSRAEFDKFVETILNGDKALNQMADGGAKKVLDFQIALPTATEKATKAIKDQISESERFLASLTKEADNFGKTSAEIKKLEAARLGVLDQAAPLIDGIEKEAKALKDAEDAANLYKNQLSKAASIAESMMTDEERFAQTQAELNQLLNTGALDVETYNRALTKAQEQLNKTGETGKQAFNELDQFAVQAARNLQTSFADALANGLDGFKNFADSAWSIIKNLAAQIASAKILQGVGLGGALGLGSSGAMASGATSAGSSILNFVGSGFGATSAISTMGGMLPGSVGAFFSGMGGGTVAGVSSSAALMGSSFAAVAGPAIALFAVDQIGRLLAGNKSTGSFVDSIPVIGGFAGALFGRGPLEQKETNLIGDITSSGFSGITSTKFKAEGGLAISDKVDRVMTDTDTGELLNQYRELVEGGISSVLDPFADQAKSYALELGIFLDSSIGGINTALRSVADTLGLGTEALDNFAMSINIASEKGQALTDEQIAQIITDAGDAMVRSLIPGIDGLMKSGESLLQTTQRLGTEFAVLENAATILNTSAAGAAEAVRALSFEQRTALVDMAGGADALNSKIGFFADNFLTTGEKVDLQYRFLLDQIGDLGFSADMSKEQYADLIKSVTQAGGVSAETANKLLDLAPVFLEFRDGLDAIAVSATDATVDLFANADQLKASGDLIRQGLFDAVNTAFTDLQNSVAAERTRITDDYNLAIKATDDQIKLVNESLDKLREVSGLIKDSVDAIDPMSLDAARSQVQAAIASGNFDSVKLKDAIGVLGQSSTAGFSSALDFQRSQAANLSLLNSLGGAVDVETLRQEQQLEELELSRKLLDEGFNNEMKRLDDIISNAQLQLDALNGIDSSIKSLADAILAFNNAASAAGTAAVMSGNPAISNAEIVNFLANNDPMTSYNAAIKYGVSSAQIAATGFYTQDQIDQFVKDNNLASFDVGGKVPRTGLALIHKDEQVLTASDSKNMSSVLSEIKQTMQAMVVATNQMNRRFMKWDGDGMPDTRTA